MDTATKHWAFVAHLGYAPRIHQSASAALLSTAFQPMNISSTSISKLRSAICEPCKGYDCLLACRVHCFLEWIFVTPVQAVVLLPIPPLCHLNALAGDGLCFISSSLVAADTKTSCEVIKVTATSIWTFILRPFLLSAPVQLSLTTGIPSAYSWFECDVIIYPSVPLPLFDTGITGLDTG